MDWLFNLLYAAWDFFGFLWDVFVILLAIGLLWSRKIRNSWTVTGTAVLDEYKRVLHIHRYKHDTGFEPYDWGGIAAYRRVRVCRCGARRTTIKGEI